MACICSFAPVRTAIAVFSSLKVFPKLRFDLHQLTAELVTQHHMQSPCPKVAAPKIIKTGSRIGQLTFRFSIAYSGDMADANAVVKGAMLLPVNHSRLAWLHTFGSILWLAAGTLCFGACTALQQQHPARHTLRVSN